MDGKGFYTYYYPDLVTSELRTLDTLMYSIISIYLN